MDDLEAKTVIVSGVGPGLGRQVALTAAREGANVVLGARTEATLAAVAAEIDGGGARVAWAAGDVADDATGRALVQTAVDRFGRVDALVNCAAYSPFGGLEQAGDFAEWRTAIEVNLIGSLQVTRAALPTCGPGAARWSSSAPRPSGSPHPRHPRWPTPPPRAPSGERCTIWPSRSGRPRCG